MKDINFNKLVGSFLLDQLSSESGQAFRFLAEMEYPCSDMKSFRERIAKIERKNLQFLIRLFEPEDFPMVTPQNAFEKFSKRGRYLNFNNISLPQASLELLADVVSGGGMSVQGTNIVFKVKQSGGVNVKCSCSEVIGPEGSSGATGNCKVTVSGDILTCAQGDCSGSCGMVISIPTPNLTGDFRVFV